MGKLSVDFAKFVLAAIIITPTLSGFAYAETGDSEDVALRDVAAGSNAFIDASDDSILVDKGISETTKILRPVANDTMLPFANGGLGLDVAVPENVKCGTTTNFLLTPKNGVGPFKYRMKSIYLMGEDGTYLVVDPSRIQYTDLEGAPYSYPFNFYASGTYYADFSVMDMGPEASGGYVTARVGFTINDPSYPSVEKIADRVARECISSGCESDFAKALWLHDWLIDHCRYDGSFIYCNPEGALARGVGTCEAYHRAYSMLLKRVGLECGRIESPEDYHVWTAVKMDGEWYQVDVTWDDAGYEENRPGYPNPKYLHFGLNDEIMGMVHQGHDSPTMGYESNSLEDNYYIRTGGIREWSDFYHAGIQANLDSRRSSFSIPAGNTSWAESGYRNIINSLIAYQLGEESWYSGGREVILSATYADKAFSFKAVYASAEEDKPVPVEKRAMYRVYNPNSGEHFYTASEYEKNSLVKVGWLYEGIGWYAPVSGADVYRLYNPNAGDHHYTTSVGERDLLMRVGWSYEGVGWKSGGSVPLYRQYNPNAAAGSHNFTTSRLENDWLASVGWHPEGIAWYGVS